MFDRLGRPQRSLAEREARKCTPRRASARGTAKAFTSSFPTRPMNLRTRAPSNGKSFLGLVDGRQAMRFPQRIFADLLRPWQAGYVRPDTPLEEVQTQLMEGMLYSLPIMSEEGSFLGAVSRDSVLHALVGREKQMFQILKQGIDMQEQRQQPDRLRDPRRIRAVHHGRAHAPGNGCRGPGAERRAADRGAIRPRNGPLAGRHRRGPVADPRPPPADAGRFGSHAGDRVADRTTSIFSFRGNRVSSPRRPPCIFPVSRRRASSASCKKP